MRGDAFDAGSLVGSIWICRSRCRRCATLHWPHVDQEKTNVPVTVPIHPRLRPILEAVPKKSRPWFFTAAASNHCPTGEHWINPNALNKDFEGLLKKLGMPAGRKHGGFTLHSLRGFFETFCVNAGVPQRAVDTWLGHRSDQSMENRGDSSPEVLDCSALPLSMLP